MRIVKPRDVARATDEIPTNESSEYESDKRPVLLKSEVDMSDWRMVCRPKLGSAS